MKQRLVGITNKRTYNLNEIALLRGDITIWRGNLSAIKTLLTDNVTLLIGDLGRRFENHYGERGIVVGLEYKQKTVVYRVQLLGHEFPTLIFRDKIKKWLTDPVSWEEGTPEVEDLTEVVQQQKQTIRDLEKEVAVLQEKLQELQNREALDKQGELKASSFDFYIQDVQTGEEIREPEINYMSPTEYLSELLRKDESELGTWLRTLPRVPFGHAIADPYENVQRVVQRYHDYLINKGIRSQAAGTPTEGSET